MDALTVKYILTFWGPDFRMLKTQASQAKTTASLTHPDRIAPISPRVASCFSLTCYFTG